MGKHQSDRLRGQPPLPALCRRDADGAGNGPQTNEPDPENIPSPTQRCKAPMEESLRALWQERQSRAARRGPRPSTTTPPTLEAEAWPRVTQG